MHTSIPLPTDNIYKFYALFGLMLFIFSVASFLYLAQSSINQALDISAAYLALDYDLTDIELLPQIQVLENKLKAEQMIATPIIYGLAFLIIVSVIMIVYGFTKWHTVIQPLQDHLVQLNIKKLEKEIGKENSQ
ncbi:hypothetical protein [Vibrio parahaemolyticus]|uniref:hypothetical protein n=1 Tax=Vibrio parahaemolyticus TaxID=670 RepID=UPI002B221263|nr:hypothetical protein [Vibrio parahaemolyticus]MEA5240873.1 hypothetical protein [Vibrio parahaemolyticus]